MRSVAQVRHPSKRENPLRSTQVTIVGTYLCPLAAPKPHGFGTITEESFALPVKNLLREVQAAEEGLEAGVVAEGVERGLHLERTHIGTAFFVSFF